MGLVWALLKLLGFILLALLVLVALVLLCPTWVYVGYDKNGPVLAVQLLGLKLRLWPHTVKQKPGRPEQAAASEPAAPSPPKQEVLKPTPAIKDEKATEASPDGATQADTGKAAEKAQLATEQVLEALRTAGWAVRRLFQALRIEQLVLVLPVQAGDPAATAIRFGRVNAWLHTALAAAHNFVHLQVEAIHTIPDFDGAHKDALAFSCRVGMAPVVLLATALYAYKRLKKAKIL